MENTLTPIQQAELIQARNMKAAAKIEIELLTIEYLALLANQKEAARKARILSWQSNPTDRAEYQRLKELGTAYQERIDRIKAKLKQRKHDYNQARETQRRLLALKHVDINEIEKFMKGNI